MRNSLFWRLSASIAIATVALFSLINYLIDVTEWQMSFIKSEHQAELINYAQQAEQLYLNNETQALKDFLQQIQSKENTWVAIVESNLNPILNTHLQRAVPRLLSTRARCRVESASLF
ncbi:histidine kinase sensor domain-containing protein [Psychromonas sp. KJ10-10]|uniref:histidine kinase sensor domain-containing protein n=1 Tax=Psychromonas sp. KJ10-10 TaxID=3391823 RepID=UPI0039B6D0DB